MMRGQGLSSRQSCPSPCPLPIAAPIRHGPSRIHTIAVRAIAAPPRPQEVGACIGDSATGDANPFQPSPGIRTLLGQRSL